MPHNLLIGLITSRQVKVTYIGKLEDGTIFDQQTSEKKALVPSNVDGFLPQS